MRCFTIAAVVAVSTVALTQIASAADLPRKAPAYIPLSPPILSWTGWYAGLNAGGMWSNQDVDTVSTSTLAAPGLNPASGPAAAAAGSTSIPTNSSGFIGGGQIGYNWQFMPQWVAGLEADIQGISRGNGTDAVSQAVVVPNSGGDFWTATTNVSSRLDYLGTGRGRVGYLVTPTLLAFGTGGVAYGGIKQQTAISWVCTSVGNGCAASNVFSGGGTVSETRFGWTVGAGVEWMAWQNWSLKAEYLYYDLGTVSNNFDSVRTTPGFGNGISNVASQSTTQFNGNIVRLGVNLHF